MRSARLACLALLLSAAALHAQASAVRDDVLKFVRAYVTATNDADATAVMDMMSKKPGVSSVSLGEITRGWEAIRTETDEMAGSEGTFKISLGTVDVTPLAGAHALVVAPVTATVATNQGPVQLRGAMTLVLEKSTGAWKVLHEHFSVPLPET